MTNPHEFAQENPQEFLRLPVEVLAGWVLKDLIEHWGPSTRPTRESYCGNFHNRGIDEGRAVAEAWAWLEFHGCLALDPSFLSGSVIFVTRRGLQLAEHLDEQPLIVEELHLRELLHTKIIAKSWAAFIRQGEEHLAVLAGFIAVEVAVREASEQSNEVYGRELMKVAFRRDGGILVDPDETPSEQEAVFFLFTGAVGYCRNPSGHTEINYSKGEAAELLMLASYLLRIVDTRRETRASSESHDGS